MDMSHGAGRARALAEAKRRVEVEVQRAREVEERMKQAEEEGRTLFSQRILDPVARAAGVERGSPEYLRLHNLVHTRDWDALGKVKVYELARPATPTGSLYNSEVNGPAGVVIAEDDERPENVVNETTLAEITHAHDRCQETVRARAQQGGTGHGR